jgi:excisionase family DNA binding protein
MIKNFLKIKEAVKQYGIGKEIFYRAIHNGELKAYIPNGRDFLLKVTEIESWIESKRLHTA